jgi:lysophospholipase L1-like esterase
VPYSNLGTHNWVISDPVLGYRLNPGRKGINSLSIRDKEIVIPKPKGLFRLIYLGDSIPWDKHGFVDYTRETLVKEGNIEVINAGVPGYGTYQELMFLKIYLLQTSPDLILLTYCLNDNHKFLHHFDEKAKMLQTKEALESLKINSEFDEIISRSYLLTRIKAGIELRWKHNTKSRFPWESRTDMGIAWKDRPWVYFEEYLVEMKDVLSKKGSRLAIVVFPFEPQLNEEYLRADYNYVLKPQKILEKLCDKHNIPCLDLFQPFHNRQKQGVRLFRDGIHLNDNGHKLAAEEILRFLHERMLLPQSIIMKTHN